MYENFYSDLLGTEYLSRLLCMAPLKTVPFGFFIHESF
jgi:hypothetical protein